MLRNILLWIIIFSSVVSYSQEFKGGITAGLTTSQINGDGFGGFYKFGATGGFYVCREFSKKSEGILELRYTQKGSSDGVPNIKIQVNYVEIPLLYKYNVNEKLGLIAGISPAIKIFESTEVNFVTSQSSDFWKWDAPYVIGVEYPLSKKINFDIRYAMSTIPVSWHYYNMCLYFGFHYKIRE